MINLKQYCTKASDNESFVGFRFEDGQPRVYFPYGLEYPDGDSAMRRSILALLSSIKQYCKAKKRDDDACSPEIMEENAKLPLLEYQYIIRDFLENGYYIESETHYSRYAKGKINWSRTIKNVTPTIDNGNVVYLEYVSRINKKRNDALITNIHKYCVYDSFLRFGWLFFPSSFLPEKPDIVFNKALFLETLRYERDMTFNDTKRRLFDSMISIIESTSTSSGDMKTSEIQYGIRSYEHVWEYMIDSIFGTKDSSEYNAHAKWYTVKNNMQPQSKAPLMPDTIMRPIEENKTFVLDAKYYRYCLSKSIDGLPGADSIQKQITYAKYISNNPKFKIDEHNIYNAFILPGNINKEQEGYPFEFIGLATADWETYDSSTLNYKYIVALYLDTSFAVSHALNKDWEMIDKLCRRIEQCLEKNKKFVFNQNV